MLKRTLLLARPILAISTSLHGGGLGTYSTFSRPVAGPSARAAPPTNSLSVQARVASGQAGPGAQPVSDQETITRLQIFLDEHSFGPWLHPAIKLGCSSTSQSGYKGNDGRDLLTGRIEPERCRLNASY